MQKEVHLVGKGLNTPASDRSDGAEDATNILGAEARPGQHEERATESERVEKGNQEMDTIHVCGKVPSKSTESGQLRMILDSGASSTVVGRVAKKPLCSTEETPSSEEHGDFPSQRFEGILEYGMHQYRRQAGCGRPIMS